MKKTILAVCIGLAALVAAPAFSVAAEAEVSSDTAVHDVATGEGESDGHEHGEGGHASHGNSNPLSVDPDLAIFTAIIFLLLAVILAKFAWGPIRDAVEAREKRIADQLAEAHRNNEEARRLLAEHESKLANATDEVKGMLDQARKDADTHKATVLAEAESAAKAEKDRAVREITAAKNSALEDLAQTSVDQAVGLAGQIMGKKLSKGDHSRLVADAMKQFPSDN